MSTKTIETITSTYNRYMMKNRAEGGELAAKKAEFLFELYSRDAVRFEYLAEIYTSQEELEEDLTRSIEENLFALKECLSRASFSRWSPEKAFEKASDYVLKNWDGDLTNITFRR